MPEIEWKKHNLLPNQCCKFLIAASKIRQKVNLMFDNISYSNLEEEIVLMLFVANVFLLAIFADAGECNGELF